MKNTKINIFDSVRLIYQRPLVKDTIITTIWNTFGKGIGLLVPFFIAAWFGVSLKTDIFFFVYAAVFYLASIFADSLESNIVPFVSKIKSEQKEKVSAFISSLFSLAFLITVGLTIILVTFARPIFGLITRFPRGSQDLLFKLFLAISPLFILMVLSSIISGLLNAYFKFWLPAISPGIRAIVCILTVFTLKQRLGIHSVTLGYILGEAVRLLLFLSMLIKNKICFLRWGFVFDPELKSFFKVLSFQVISMVVIGLNPLIDKTMASWLEVGSVSMLQYADRLYFIPVIFLSSGLIVVVLSHWSDEYYKHKNIEILRENTRKVMGVVGVISVSLTVLFFIFSWQIVRFAYARGHFPLGLLGLVRGTFLFYLAGITFYLMSQILVKAHLVLKNTKTLMKAALISFVLNIIFNVIFMRIIGVRGIAFATTITYIVTFLYLYVSFGKIKKELVSAL